MSREPGALWAWATEIYERPGVKEALLELQDRHDVDVVRLLFRLWLSAEGLRLDPETDARAAAFCAEWRSGVVAPLRAARDRLKNSPVAVDPEQAQALRRQTLAVELSAEKLQLDVLEEMAAAGRPEPAGAAEPLATLLEFPEIANCPPTDLIALAKALSSR